MNAFLKNNLKFITQFREQMSDNKLMFCYKGEMTQEVVLALLNLAENNLNQTTLDSSIKTRVFSVMVECLQNITRLNEKNEQAKSNMFMVGHGDPRYNISGYNVYSGSVINKEFVEVMRDKITEINSMSEEDLKKFYKYLITNELLSEKSGFGLGLFHIARKTGNALEFDFEQLDNENYFFALSTMVDH